MISDKVKPHHLERKALLYVRQSSAQQVLHNRESSTLQYAMRDRLAALGWSQIEVIDDDLGRSAAGTVQRAGFERMVAEVCLGKVGAVCAREVSRFARNSRDWQQLTEMCRVVDTVLVDHETIYAPRDGNDRLLLGLKGSLNEYELDLLRQYSDPTIGAMLGHSSASVTGGIFITSVLWLHQSSLLSLKPNRSTPLLPISTIRSKQTKTIATILTRPLICRVPQAIDPVP
jgi:hypothetical protein